jgi:hypothetical protein
VDICFLSSQLSFLAEFFASARDRTNASFPWAETRFPSLYTHTNDVILTTIHGLRLCLTPESGILFRSVDGSPSLPILAFKIFKLNWNYYSTLESDCLEASLFFGRSLAFRFVDSIIFHSLSVCPPCSVCFFNKSRRLFPSHRSIVGIYLSMNYL